MIAQLTGLAIDKGLDGCCVLDVQGVGYEVFVPLRSLSRLPDPPSTSTVLVHTHVREDTFRLYGFVNAHDRVAFRALLAVTGVGPKLALAILSEMDAGEIAGAVARDDKKRFAAVSGIGKKMAERLVLELKDKLDPPHALTPGLAPGNGANGVQLKGRAGEVAAALSSLGFSRLQAETAAQKVVQADDARPLEGLVRQALSLLG